MRRSKMVPAVGEAMTLIAFYQTSPQCPGRIAGHSSAERPRPCPGEEAATYARRAIGTVADAANPNSPLWRPGAGRITHPWPPCGRRKPDRRRRKGVIDGRPAFAGGSNADRRVRTPHEPEGELIVTDPEKNKQTVIAFYDLVTNGKRPAEAVEKYGGSHYIQHDPNTPDGFEAFIQALTDVAERYPRMSLEIKRAVAEGDLVVTHSLLKYSPEDRGTAAADFFRLEDGKIVEHWDVFQPVPESAANDRPMF